MTEARQRGFDVPIVMMTGVEREGTRETCLSAGATDLLIKPVDARTTAMVFDRLGGHHRVG
jgi:CheY-like chemotaxis protein